MSSSEAHANYYQQRLIPDTENYLAAVFDLLGVSVPTPTETTPAATPSETPSETSSPTTVASPLVKAEHGKPINLDATPVIIADGVTYSATIKHENQKPFENIQIGPGYQGGKKLAASDLPIIFTGLETELASRLRDAVDSSDELGLDDVFGF